MSTTLPYVKVYTITINRIAIENYRWYYNQKGNKFKCALVAKENSENAYSPMFLVLNEEDGGVSAPTAYRTIRPLECTVISEKIIDDMQLYHFLENYNSTNAKEKRKKLSPLKVDTSLLT